jgi:hypothetical protein
MTQRSTISMKMRKETYGSKIGLLCQRKNHSRRTYWMKLIHRGTLFIQGVPRCIMTYDINSSGHE